MVLALLSTTAFAQTLPGQDFNHFSTGFPLFGSHATVSCDACHLNGLFKGTPTRCIACHDGRVALGKSNGHIPTTASCDTCHNPRSETWIVAAGSFDHAGVVGNCVSCHNGSKAIGKPTTHIATTDKCEACHRNTQLWTSDTKVDHNEVVGTCSQCHNGTIATGMSAQHIKTGLACDVCHRSTQSWESVQFDHGGIVGDCVSCHNGAGVIGKPSSHIAATDRCEACHKSTQAFSTVTVDHTQVKGVCSSCHDGKTATGKGANHVQTTQECSACHNVNGWAVVAFDHTGITNNCTRCHNGAPTPGKPSGHIRSTNTCEACHTTMNWEPKTVDHAQIIPLKPCSECHNGTIAAGKALSTHIPTPAGLDCDACHSLPPQTFATAAGFDHSLVTSLRCDACHLGPFVSSGAIVKPPNHVPTLPGVDCGACHTAPGTTFTLAVFDHTGIISNCASCHDGIQAPGRGNSHVPTPSGVDCSICHRVPPDPLTTAALFNHSLVASQRCDTCHSGIFLNAGAAGKPANHIPTPAGADCVSCHRVQPDTFATAGNFSHTLVTAMRCDSCHNGNFAAAGAVGKAANHVATLAGQDCNACHKNTTSFVGATFDHTGITNSCATCHNGSVALGKSGSHIPTLSGVDCAACHRVPPDLLTTASLFNHSLVASQRCDVCHSGAYVASGATGKSASHIPFLAGMDCSACHRVMPDTFATAGLFSHASVTSMRCDTCHSGNFAASGAIGKTANHPATTAGQDCNVCHKNTISFAGAAFDHVGVTSNCASCHNGSSAIGKPANHIPTPAGVDCSSCHRIPPEAFSTASLFNHSIVESQRCDACHGGAYAGVGAAGKSASHIPTLAGVDCRVCHRVPPDTFATAGLFSHASVASQRCDVCHNGAYAAAGALGKSATHIPFPAGMDCTSCHRVPPDTFATAGVFSHSLVTAMRCDACHSGAYTASGASGKTTNHPATSAGQDCNACHKNTTSFAGAAFDHTGITSNCASCHNGSSAPGKSGSHIPTPAGVDCSVCHRVPPDLLSTASLFNHSQVTSMRCDACHNGSYTASGAQGKSAGHPATAAGQDCNACHKSTTTFAGATFDHTGITSGCSNCHNGSTATGKPAGHLPVPAGSNCNLCHRVPPDTFATAGLFKHSSVTTMRCDTCHNGQYRSYGASGKPSDHPTVAAGQDCNACHNTGDW